MSTPSVTMPTRIYSSPEFIRSLLCYRRSQPSVKPMNATNITMVTSTIIASSIQILLMGYGIPRTLGSFLIFQFGDCVAISPLSSLCCQSQQSIHRKWFGQVRQRAKFQQAAWADPYRRKHGDGQLPGIPIHLHRSKPSLLLRAAQHLPTRLVRQADVQQAKVKRAGSELSQRGVCVFRDVHVLAARLHFPPNHLPPTSLAFDT